MLTLAGIIAFLAFMFSPVGIGLIVFGWWILFETPVGVILAIILLLVTR
jgi:hypothetical protein